MRLVWAVIPVFLIVSMIGIVGVQESFATTCTSGTTRIEDVKSSSQDIEIGKDTVIVSGKIVSLVDRIQTIHIGILSNNIGSTYFQTCSIQQNIFESFGNDGEHFEMVSDQLKTITLEPSEIISFEMELRPLKSGNFVINLITHSPELDKTYPSYPISRDYERVTVTGEDTITMYDVMFVGLFSIIGVGIFFAVFLILGNNVKRID